MCVRVCNDHATYRSYITYGLGERTGPDLIRRLIKCNSHSHGSRAVNRSLKYKSIHQFSFQ